MISQHNVDIVEHTGCPARIDALRSGLNLPRQFASLDPNHSSGGYRRRVAVPRASALGLHNLTLEEPVYPLEMCIQVQVAKLLTKLQERGLWPTILPSCTKAHSWRVDQLGKSSRFHCTNTHALSSCLFLWLPVSRVERKFNEYA
jgi:ABC-type molybdate transport system ATPase subunit